MLKGLKNKWEEEQRKTADSITEVVESRGLSPPTAEPIMVGVTRDVGEVTGQLTSDLGTRDVGEVTGQLTSDLGTSPTPIFGLPPRDFSSRSCTNKDPPLPEETLTNYCCREIVPGMHELCRPTPSTIHFMVSKELVTRVKGTRSRHLKRAQQYDCFVEAKDGYFVLKNLNNDAQKAEQALEIYINIVVQAKRNERRGSPPSHRNSPYPQQTFYGGAYYDYDYPIEQPGCYYPSGQECYYPPGQGCYYPPGQGCYYPPGQQFRR